MLKSVKTNTTCRFLNDDTTCHQWGRSCSLWFSERRRATSCLSLFCLAAADDEAMKIMKQNPNHRKFTDRNLDHHYRLQITDYRLKKRKITIYIFTFTPEDWVLNSQLKLLWSRFTRCLWNKNCKFMVIQPGESSLPVQYMENSRGYITVFTVYIYIYTYSYNNVASLSGNNILFYTHIDITTYVYIVWYIVDSHGIVDDISYGINYIHCGLGST